MSEEDELLLGTIAGVDLILSPEHYKKYKETLNKQIEEYQKALDETTSEKIDLENIIKEVREYIERNTEEKKSWLNGIPDYTVFKGDANELLKILDKAGSEKNE